MRARLDRFVLRSLRARLTLAGAVTIACALAVVWWLLAAMFEDNIERLLEDDLKSRLIELAGAIAIDASGRVTLENEPTDPRYQRPAGGAYWRIDVDGGTALRSISLWDFNFAPADKLHLSPTGFATKMQGPNGSSVYLASREVVLDGAGGSHRVRILAALDMSGVQRLLNSFGRQATIALGVIAAALSIGTWIQWSFGLRPLNRIRRQLGRVRSGVDARMTGDFPSEIAPLVDDLNKLLGRHEELVRRARVRAGDLAHGLKTPLTIMRSEARIAERRGDLRTSAALSEQIDVMNRHIERELKRARMAGASGGGGLVDPHDAIERLIRAVQRMPNGDAIDWMNDLPTDFRMKMDPDDFSEIAGNLLDNARKYSRSRLRIALVAIEGQQWVCFDDDGPGIPIAERDRIVARGERDAPDAEGFGLGLSIVIELLGLYGLTLRIEDSPWGGCRIAFQRR